MRENLRIKLFDPFNFEFWYLKHLKYRNHTPLGAQHDHPHGKLSSSIKSLETFKILCCLFVSGHN
jgi:hypothetical protein